MTGRCRQMITSRPPYCLTRWCVVAANLHFFDISGYFPQSSPGTAVQTTRIDREADRTFPDAPVSVGPTCFKRSKLMPPDHSHAPNACKQKCLQADYEKRSYDYFTSNRPWISRKVLVFRSHDNLLPIAARTGAQLLVVNPGIPLACFFPFS